MFVASLDKEQTVRVGDVVIKFIGHNGRRAMIAIDAPKTTPIKIDKPEQAKPAA